MNKIVWIALSTIALSVISLAGWVIYTEMTDQPFFSRYHNLISYLPLNNAVRRRDQNDNEFSTMLKEYQGVLRDMEHFREVVPDETCPDVFRAHRYWCNVKGCNTTVQGPKERLRKLHEIGRSISPKDLDWIDMLAGQSSQYADYVFITAGSSDHFRESLGLLIDLQEKVFPAFRDGQLLGDDLRPLTFRFVYYDLGLKKGQVKQVQEYCSCTVISFPFDKMPAHTQTPKKYAWKPVVMKAHLRYSSVSVWMDSSTRFFRKRQNFTSVASLLASFRRSPGVFVTIGKYTMGMHTHPSMATFFGVQDPCQLLPYNEIQSGFVALRNNPFIQRAIVDPWVACSLSPLCLCPSRKTSQGERRGKKEQGVDVDGEWEDCLQFKKCLPKRDFLHMRCHRYDQSALGIILMQLFQRRMNALAYACSQMGTISFHRGDITTHIDFKHLNFVKNLKLQ